MPSIEHQMTEIYCFIDDYLRLLREVRISVEREQGFRFIVNMDFARTALPIF
ncbi:MAG: hypothetical protein WKF30_10255 [Pyrinomonadaceae bacterium]